MADIKQYWQELAKKAGVSEEKAKLIMDALGDDTVQKAFKDGFVETPQHHSTLDKRKGEWEGKVTQSTARATELETWYNNQAKPAMDRMTANWDALQKYQQLYGELPADMTTRQTQQVAQATGLTKAEVDEMLRQRDNAYVGLTKDVSFITTDHMQRFKEPLDLDALEKEALKTGLPLRQVYKDFIRPKEDAMMQADIEAKVKAAREEGARDALSKHQLPVETRPKDPHPFFDRKEPSNGVVSEQQAERAGKEAFFETWNNYQDQPTK